MTRLELLCFCVVFIALFHGLTASELSENDLTIDVIIRSSNRARCPSSFIRPLAADDQLERLTLLKDHPLLFSRSDWYMIFMWDGSTLSIRRQAGDSSSLPLEKLREWPLIIDNGFHCVYLQQSSADDSLGARTPYNQAAHSSSSNVAKEPWFILIVIVMSVTLVSIASVVGFHVGKQLIRRGRYNSIH
jgi:hypothetical protein